MPRRCDLGYVFLRFCATEHLCRALLHAGCAIAQPGNHRIVFFLALVSRRQNASFYLAAIAISLSILIKVTSIVIVAPILYLVVGRLYQTPGVSQNGAGGSRATWTGRSPD